MKKLCLTVALLCATPAVAQDVECGPAAMIEQALMQSYDQRTSAMGVVGPSTLLVLYVNDATDSFAIVTVEHGSGLACVRAIGQSWSEVEQ